MADQGWRGREAELYPESVTPQTFDPLRFPFDAWEFDLPTDSPRDIILKDGNRLQVPALTFGYSKSGPKTLSNENHTIADTDTYTVYILSGTLDANRTVTLPTLADNQSRFLQFIDISTHGAYKWILDGEGAETIDGFTTIEFAFACRWSYTIYGYSTEWKSIEARRLSHLLRSPSGWDVNAIACATYPEATPYTWDLSSLIPVGTKSVLISGLSYYATTSEVYDDLWYVWNYDDGAFSSLRDLTRGMFVSNPHKAASATSRGVRGTMVKQIAIGPSRKLKCGFGGGATVPPLYAMLCDYSM